MTPFEWIAYGLVCVAAVAATVADVLVAKSDRVARLGGLLCLFAGFIGTVGLTARWAQVGHPPLFGTFENTYTAATVALGVGGVSAVMRRGNARVWRLLAPWAVVFLAWGARYRSKATPITISEQSLWVDVHVLFAWVCLISLLVATTAAIVHLRSRTALAPQQARSEAVQLRFLLVGFVAMTLMLATGSWYSYLLFGVFWQWEIVETINLIAWLAYAMIIHGALFSGLSGRRFDVAVLAVLPALLLGFFIWSVFPATFHYFDIPLVRPY